MHLGSRHQLAGQRRRQRAIGDILGDKLKSELFSELELYEKEKKREVEVTKPIRRKPVNSKLNGKSKIKRPKSPQTANEEEDDSTQIKTDPRTMLMMCRDRVRKKNLHDKMVRDRLEQEKKMKKDRAVEDNAKAEIKAAEAKKRLIIRERRKKEREAEELNDLILRLPNSIDATNLTRLLNPEFQPKYVYEKACNKSDELRVRSLMAKMDL